MTTISNIVSTSSTPSAVPSAYAAPAETAALTLGTPAEPASKVTVLDERNATARDSTGRTLKVRRLSAIDKVKLFRSLGAIDSESWGRMLRLPRRALRLTARPSRSRRHRCNSMHSSPGLMSTDSKRSCAAIAVASLVSAAALTSMTPAHAGPLTCSTWQQITTCQDGRGYVSRELQWQGMTIGDDNDGARWTTDRWQGFTTTTVTPPPDRR
jgi:hypothetical protein